MRDTSRALETDGNTGVEASDKLAEIQKELDALTRRRSVLEEQRKKLLSDCNSTPSGGDERPLLYGRGGSVDFINRNHSQYTGASFSPQLDRSVFRNNSRIPSEAERLKSLKKNVFREMKESMRKSWERDSSLVMGSFLLEDNPRASTFGRERRFVPIVDQKGPYYLSTDLELMQKHKNQLITNATASRRGESGMNISSHWNDLQCVGSPGPGAYTPHYNKVSKPSVLTRR